MQALKLLYYQSFEKQSYEFFIRKRIDRRMWSVIGSHLKALETHAVNEKFSHSSWNAFNKAFDEYYNNVQ